MRPGSTTFWQNAEPDTLRSRRHVSSLALAVLFALAAGLGPCSSPAVAQKARQERQLAGIRVGKDRQRTATNLHGDFFRVVRSAGAQQLLWLDTAKRRAMRVDFDAAGVVSSVTVSLIDPAIREGGAPDAPLPSPMIATGRGLRLNYNYCPDVRETYGEPTASREDVLEGWHVEILTYEFEKEPQMFEAVCERGGGKVLQFRLSARIPAAAQPGQAK